MLLAAGVHKFVCEAPDFLYASASAPSMTRIVVKRNGVEEDMAYIVGSTHTWWSNNPLFNPPLAPGDKIAIEIIGPGVMRFECGGLKKEI